MSFYESIVRPLLFALSRRDPEVAHGWALAALRMLGKCLFCRRLCAAYYGVRDSRLGHRAFGVDFPNPVGLAAGFDKDGEALKGLEALGFGFIELGTVTRHAQPGNPRPRMFRLAEDKALINRMGFNNEGADAVAARLKKEGKLSIPLGVSIGKSKITPLKEAAEDYAYSFRALYPYGDYFAVNVSSPNTPGLRALQEAEQLDRILAQLVKEREALQAGLKTAPKPILVKIAPDLSFEAIDAVLKVCAARGVAGIIAVNTTLSREGAQSGNATEAGGLSGKPLFQKALEIVRHIRARAPEFAIIAGGGIFTAEDAFAMLGAGADLLQVYTGFIYRGPGLAREINRGLLRLIARCHSRESGNLGSGSPRARG
ncbi:MAG: quinone-dependent dihydroorotate dehydrogenase [Candidatus Liptonbacteria bacterium]|nr:quinone-dependent dihydroorotate dehydrogenase [Candidatus Liptonbacteria bacterium]